MKVQRLHCEECGHTRQEEIKIADQKKLYLWIKKICIDIVKLHDSERFISGVISELGVKLNQLLEEGTEQISDSKGEIVTNKNIEMKYP